MGVLAKYGAWAPSHLSRTTVIWSASAISEGDGVKFSALFGPEPPRYWALRASRGRHRTCMARTRHREVESSSSRLRRCDLVRCHDHETGGCDPRRLADFLNPDSCGQAGPDSC